MIDTIQQGLEDDGYAVSISQLCRWFDIPRSTVLEFSDDPVHRRSVADEITMPLRIDKSVAVDEPVEAQRTKRIVAIPEGIAVGMNRGYLTRNCSGWA